MAELKATPLPVVSCCAPERQADCCAPSEKAECCVPGANDCGCRSGGKA